MSKFGEWFKTKFPGMAETIKELKIPVISQVASMATGLLGSHLQKSLINNHMSGAEREAFNLNAQEAQKARDWNLEVDNTKYQRQVTDMQKAGINPALAMNGGVTTQATSNATGNASTQQSPIMAIQDFATLAMNLKNLKAQNQNLEAKTRLDNANAEAVEIENKYRDENQQLIQQGLINANNISAAQEKKIYKDMEEADSRIAENIEKAKTEREKQYNLAADTILKKANARQIVALTPVLVKLHEAQTEKEKAIAAQAFAQAAYQQGLIDSGYIEALAEKEGFNAEQARQIALNLSAENAKRGYADTMSNGEKYYDDNFSKFCMTTLWTVGDLLGNVLNVGVNFQGNTSDSRSTSHSTSQSTVNSTSTSTSNSTSHVYTHGKK